MLTARPLERSFSGPAVPGFEWHHDLDATPHEARVDGESAPSRLDSPHERRRSRPEISEGSRVVPSPKREAASIVFKFDFEAIGLEPDGGPSPRGTRVARAVDQSFTNDEIHVLSQSIRSQCEYAPKFSNTISTVRSSSDRRCSHAVRRSVCADQEPPPPATSCLGFS